MKKARRRSTHPRDNKTDKGEKNAASSNVEATTPIPKESLLAAATAVGIAYLALPHFILGIAETALGSGNSQTFGDRLMEDWPAGGLVTIKTIGEGNRGLFATRDIEKGSVVVSVDYIDLAQEITQQYRNLEPMVDTALKNAIKDQGAALSTLTSRKVLSLIKFLMEFAQGKDSIWSSYIAASPQNISNVALYWTEEEKKCIVPRPGFESKFQDLQVFHAVMDEVRQHFPPLAEIYSKERAEWAYLMLKTRGFREFFLPMLDLANHNPLAAVSVFLTPKTGAARIVATHDIKAGDPVYNSYGSLSPVVTAECYGFVESEEDSTFFEVPSIHEDMLQSAHTKNEPLCTSGAVIFFGNVTEQVVGAKFSKQSQSTYFKAFMPTERAYACIRVLLQTERDTDVAGYIADKMEAEFQRYAGMAKAPNCQSPEGNFPLIRKANHVTARLLRGAVQAAGKVRPYPGIPTFTRIN